jgi:hypothetical protein
LVADENGPRTGDGVDLTSVLGARDMTIRNADLYVAAGGTSDEAGELDALGADLAGASMFRIRGGGHDEAVALAHAGVNLWDARPELREVRGPARAEHRLAG